MLPPGSAAAALGYNLALELPPPAQTDGGDELWSSCFALPRQHAEATAAAAADASAGHAETARRLLLCVGQMLLRADDEARALALSVELPDALGALAASRLCAEDAPMSALVAEVLSALGAAKGPGLL